MNKLALFALAAAPFAVVAAGIVAGRLSAHAEAGERCVEPTVHVNVRDCEAGACRVDGPNQVEVRGEGRVQCVELREDMALALSRRDGRMSLIVEERVR